LAFGSHRGSRRALNETLQQGVLTALGGNVFAEFDELEGDENAIERHSGKPLLEIYSPIREPWSGNIIGVAEFYEVADGLGSELTRTQNQSWLVVGSVKLGMLALLFGIVVRGSQLIDTQRHSLRQRLAEHSAMLDQNRALRLRADQATHRTAALNERYLRKISVRESKKWADSSMS
jgi:hypothetical protein